jgi:hypothetical protein
MSLLKDIIFRLTSKNNQSKYQFKSDSEKESSAFNETEINNIQPQNDKRADNKFVIRRPVFVRGIIDAVAEQELALVRQIAMYLLR